MATFTQLETKTQYLIEDANQMYWTTGTSGTMRRELEYAELLISLFRGGTEKTADFSLTANTPSYSITSVLAGGDFIVPLRITISNTPLRKTNLSSLVRLDDQLRVTTGTPECWYMMGDDGLGFYPVPNTNSTAKVTFLRIPPTASAGSPVIADEWHFAMPLYAAAICYGAEGKIPQATEYLNEFIKTVGIPFFHPFMRGASQKKPTSAEKPLREQED